MKTIKNMIAVTAVLVLSISTVRAAGTWFDSLIEQRQAASGKPSGAKKPTGLPDFGKGAYTLTAWIKTTGDGTIFAQAPDKGRWSRGGKSLFISGGRLHFDIGFVGVVRGRARVANGKWRHVAFSGPAPQKIYVDGKLDATGRLDSTSDVKGHVFKLGYTCSNFPGRRGGTFKGAMDDVRLYSRVLSDKEIAAMVSNPRAPRGGGLAACWTFDGSASDVSGGLNHATPRGRPSFTGGKYGKAATLGRSGHFIVRSDGKGAPGILATLAGKFSDEASKRQMAWEAQDGIWTNDWKTAGIREIAGRYARAARRPTSLAERIAALAAKAGSVDDLKAVRELYLKSRRYGAVLESIAEFKLEQLRQTINTDYKGSTKPKALLARLDAIEKQAGQWGSKNGPPSGKVFDAWKASVATLRHDAIFGENPLFDFDKLLFIKRQTYHSSHFYTDFIDGCSRYGGNLCVLDMKTRKVTDLIPEMKEGIFGRFDLHFDANRIVFDWKKAPKEGFRIYEIGIDPVKGVRTGDPRQITFRPSDESARIKKYDNSFIGGTARMYYHQTDDMHPCYLSDGGIMFVSSRCEFGTLCDAPDALSTAVMYRVDGDGKNMQQLTKSPVSEFSPSMMSDGRVLYTRWEYVDKGQLGVKCLWAMYPDGSGTVEVYGNDITFPPTFLHGRQIPGYSNLFVMLGTPHYPQSGIGTVIRVDTTKDIRTREPMTYITPHVDIRQEPGWNHLVNGKWTRHTNGPLYMDPYPLSASTFLVAYNPDKKWNDPVAYGLYTINDSGSHVKIHTEEETSCWRPYPLRTRKKPPVLRSIRDPELAKKNLALCTVQDIYFGMEGIKRGEVKYIRVMEQVPRPWDCRRFWDQRNRLNHHTRLVSLGTALATKVMWGVVPVETDGSAHFVVPADRNIYFQALDENYMELQRERTYVNYRPGEKRSCVGCHETPNDSPPHRGKLPTAMKRPPSKPGPQPGDKTGRRAIHYPSYIQPILDKHCVRCHGAKAPAAKLDLTGELTRIFSRSYENLMRRGAAPTYREASDWGGTPYAPPKSIGSHKSRLIAQLRKGCTGNDEKLPQADFVKFATWVDASGVYYGSYWGRRHIQFKDHPNFRPVPTFEEAISTKCPLPVDKR